MHRRAIFSPMETVTTMRAAGPWGHKECKKKFFIQNPQFELYIFSRIGLLALSLVVKQISKVEDCHCIVWRGSLSTVFDRFVISCEFLAAIFLPQSRKCYWKMIQINSWGAAFFFPQASILLSDICRRRSSVAPCSCSTVSCRLSSCSSKFSP